MLHFYFEIFLAQVFFQKVQGDQMTDSFNTLGMPMACSSIVAA